MTIDFGNGKPVQVGNLTFDQWREFMSEYLSLNPYASRAWDLLTCLRGPDFPSERGDMTPKESGKAYAGRRERKFKTVEVIREAAFFGTVGGAARSHKGDRVLVPAGPKQDHFDRHVIRAANVIGLKVEVEK